MNEKKRIKKQLTFEQLITPHTTPSGQEKRLTPATPYGNDYDIERDWSGTGLQEYPIDQEILAQAIAYEEAAIYEMKIRISFNRGKNIRRGGAWSSITSPNTLNTFKWLYFTYILNISIIYTVIYFRR